MTPLSQRTRRGLVLLSLLLYGLIFVPALTSYGFIAAVVALQLLLFAFTGYRGRQALTAPDRALDERQLRDKLHIFRLSYYLIMGLAALMIVFNVVLPAGAKAAATVAFFMLILSLPTYLLMWLEPAPMSDDPQGAPHGRTA